MFWSQRCTKHKENRSSQTYQQPKSFENDDEECTDVMTAGQVASSSERADGVEMSCLGTPLERERVRAPELTAGEGEKRGKSDFEKYIEIELWRGLAHRWNPSVVQQNHGFHKE